MLTLSRSEVAKRLSLDDCIDAVECAFRLQGEGRLPAAGVLGMPAEGGGFHLKAATLGRYFAAKVNGNFSANPSRFGLPAIQGLVYLADATNGAPLATMDSIEITILRTGAATAIAAKYLARADSRSVTICGCGNQGRVQLRALSRVLKLERAFAWDIDLARAAALAGELSGELRIEIAVTDNLAEAVAQSDVCVTCTPSRAPFLRAGYLRPGIFVAAVGADSPDKQELHAGILEAAKLVVDVREQCAAIGELHHAPGARVHGELGEIVAGRKPGRETDAEIVVFDSTGTAIQDVAAAAAIYEKATSPA